jgi:D-glycero-alpha-D-manno-heptose-7-phosphate kinase
VIHTRAPLRLPLGGGGTDLPEYATRFGAHVIAATLDLWVDVTLERPLDDRAVRVEEDTLLAAASLLGVEPRAAFTASDRPHGTGLGSSGALLVALVLALAHRSGRPLPPEELADLAFRLERDRLGRPVGTQDPYVAAAGGFVSLRASSTSVRPSIVRLTPSSRARAHLESRLWLVDLALPRDAGAVLRVQSERLAGEASSTVGSMRAIHELAPSIERELERDTPDLGPLFDRHWRAKRGVHERMTSNAIDHLYARGLGAGATGGKLVGAGGGGTLLFDVPKDRRAAFEACFQALDLATTGARFSERGAHVVDG